MFFITVKILKNTEMGGYILSDIIILIRSNFGVMVKNIYSQARMLALKSQGR